MAFLAIFLQDGQDIFGEGYWCGIGLGQRHGSEERGESRVFQKLHV